MSKQREKERTQADSELYGLLESLLSEVGAETESKVDAPPVRQEAARPFAEPEQASTALLIEPVVDLLREVVEKTDQKILNKPAERPLEILETETAATTRRRPEWARNEFNSLMFRVNGQLLAIPVLELAGVTPCPEHITPMPGQPAWHMGVLEYRGSKMVAVDLSKVLDVRETAETAARECFLLAVGEGRYGLRCDAMPEPIRVDPRDVRWSHDIEGRGMLAGILSKQMCPLLNVDNVLAHFRHI